MISSYLRLRGGRARELAEANARRTQGMVVHTAAYDFRQLLNWYKGHVLPNVLRLSAVTMTDINERVNRIQVGVESVEHLEPTRRFLSRLPIPPGAVEVVVERPAVPTSSRTRVEFSGGVRTSRSLTDSLRPVPGGARIRVYESTNHWPCTLGFNVVKWVSGNVQSQRYFLTNGHCGNFGQMDGFYIAQQQFADGIGDEVADPGFINPCGYHPSIGVLKCRYSDASLAQYDTAGHSDQGRVAMPALGQTSFDSTSTVSEVYAPEVGRPAHMIGATSGRTAGTIDRSCAHVRWAETNIIMLCQGRADYEADDGDSGAPVVERLGDGSVVYAVGLHWGHETVGGKSWFSPLYSVLGELEASSGVLDPVSNPTDPPVLPGPPPDFEVVISGMTLVGPMTECEWAAIVSGGESPFTYAWSGLLSGTASTVYGSMTQSGYLFVTVVDALGVERTASLLIDYDPEAELYCM